MSTKQERIEYRDRLVQFANDLGFDVELDSPMPDYDEKREQWKVALRKALDSGELSQKDFDEHIDDEQRPAGDCNYLESRIRVREGKGLNGQIATLAHELCHALAFGGISLFSMLGSSYNELACESVTELVCRACGVDRTAKTSNRILDYGFGAYLISPATVLVTEIILDNIGLKLEIE